MNQSKLILAIRDLLEYEGIDYSRWPDLTGQSIQHLIYDIESGVREMVIGRDNISLITRLVRINIVDEDRGNLLEVGYSLPDGTFRHNLRQDKRLSGKVRYGELPETALNREVMEKLGLSFDQFDYLTFNNGYSEDADSSSFPGLKSRYDIYDYTLKLNALNDLPDEITHQDGDRQLVFRWYSHEVHYF